MNAKYLRGWETLSREVILNHNKFLQVENHVVKTPDGVIIPDWGWVITPDAINVVAVTPEQRFLCLRQKRYAVAEPSLAPVGGFIEPGEAPLEAAKRELLEEMGCESPDWINLGSYVTEPNRGVGTLYEYLALNVVQVAEPDSGDLEDQELLWLSRSEIETALRTGGFKIISWAAAMALALNYLATSG
jgi:ADP-ribose pyrophosphatase